MASSSEFPSRGLLLVLVLLSVILMFQMQSVILTRYKFPNAVFLVQRETFEYRLRDGNKILKSYHLFNPKQTPTHNRQWKHDKMDGEGSSIFNAGVNDGLEIREGAIVRDISKFKDERRPPFHKNKPHLPEFQSSGYKTADESSRNKGDYILNNLKACQSDHDSAFNISLAVIVLCVTEHIERRNSWRHNWGSTTEVDGEQVRVIYFMETMGNKTLEKEIEKEQVKYNDVVLSKPHFKKDRYSTGGTSRTIAALRWALNFCVNTRHLLLIDEGIFVMIPRIVKYLNEQPSNEIFLHGGHGIPAGQRNFNYFDEGRPFRAFAILAMPFEALSLLVNASEKMVDTVYTDDGFVGLCALEIGVMPQKMPGFVGERHCHERPLYQYVNDSSIMAVKGLSLKEELYLCRMWQKQLSRSTLF